MELIKITEENILVYQVVGNLLGDVDGRPITNEYNADVEKGVKKIIFDLGGLKYINSTGLGNLIKIMINSKANDIDVVFCNIPEHFQKLITITKLNSIFKFAKTVDEAKAMMEA